MGFRWDQASPAERRAASENIAKAEAKAQGLPDKTTDPKLYRLLARILRRR